MQKAEEDLSRLTKLAERIVKKIREYEKVEYWSEGYARG
jgi:hypothetical protein